MKIYVYVKNLWRALRGENPYGSELVELTRTAEVQSEIIESLTEDCCNHNEKSEWVQSRLEEVERTYQNLTENLRQRIKEKDEQIADQSLRYADAITTLRLQHKMAVEGLETKNEELKADLDATLDELQKVKADIGREMMSANLLHKTNCALVDLLQAMESGNIEKMKMVVEYLSWNHILSRIAQCHLDFLKGKRKK